MTAYVGARAMVEALDVELGVRVELEGAGE